MPRLSFTKAFRMPRVSTGQSSTVVQTGPSSAASGLFVCNGAAVMGSDSSPVAGAMVGFADMGSIMAFFLGNSIGASLYTLTGIPLNAAVVAVNYAGAAQLLMPAGTAYTSQPIYYLGNYLDVPYAMNSGPVISQATAKSAGLTWLAVAADGSAGMAGFYVSLDSGCKVTYFAGTPS